MKSVLKSFIALLLLLSWCDICSAQDKSPAQKTEPEKKASPSPSPSPAANASKIDFPIPEGEPAYGIKYPHYNDKGELAMEFEAGVVRKLDPSRIEMKDLKITINEENKKYFIEMQHSLFNMDTSMLVSDTPTTIRRDDFEIIGDTAEFNTKTRFSKMVGKVKMTLFNLQPEEK